MDALMYCFNKKDNNIYRIFDIAYDSNGYPSFLYFDGNQWIREKAKHFIPIEPEIIEDTDIESDTEIECDGDCMTCGVDHRLPPS